jgi:uncharacterized LabA/DUF88 family protein
MQKRPLKMTSNGKKRQIEVDVFLYRDMTELAEEDAFDIAVLVSDDEDFVDAVCKLQQIGKHIEIWSFRGSLSQNLKEKAGKEHIHYLDEIIEKIKLPLPKDILLYFFFFLHFFSFFRYPLLISFFCIHLKLKL